MIEIDLYTRLKDDAALSALVGSRIYPKKAPQNVQTPYIVYHVITDTNNQCIEGEVYQSDTRFQIDCWSKKYSEVVLVKNAVKASIIGFKSSYQISTMDDYEPETELYREMIDLTLKG